MEITIRAGLYRGKEDCGGGKWEVRRERPVE